MRLTILAITCTGSVELNALPTDCCRISFVRLTICAIGLYLRKIISLGKMVYAFKLIGDSGSFLSGTFDSGPNDSDEESRNASGHGQSGSKRTPPQILPQACGQMQARQPFEIRFCEPLACRQSALGRLRKIRRIPSPTQTNAMFQYPLRRRLFVRSQATRCL